MRTKMTWLGLLLSATVALGCGAAGSVADDSGSDSGGGSLSSGEDSGGDDGGSEPADVAGIGDPVRDGKFEFTVGDVECGVDSVGNEFLGEQAQGQFCLVTVDVTNIGDEPQTFSDSDQKAFTAEGVEYSTNSAASIYANENDSVFFNEINPGNKITGVLVFDVPADVQLASLELHDSFLSGGVTVALS